MIRSGQPQGDHMLIGQVLYYRRNGRRLADTDSDVTQRSRP